jgi:hypothetical protein
VIVAVYVPGSVELLIGEILRFGNFPVMKLAAAPKLADNKLY